MHDVLCTGLSLDLRANYSTLPTGLRTNDEDGYCTLIGYIWSVCRLLGDIARPPNCMLARRRVMGWAEVVWADVPVDRCRYSYYSYILLLLLMAAIVMAADTDVGRQDDWLLW